MAKFTGVEVWPPTGHPDRLWDQHGIGTPEVTDAFLRSARSVSELYSEALASQGLVGDWQVFRIHLGASRDPQRVVVDIAEERQTAIGEAGYVRLPPPAGELDPRARAALLLEAGHAACLRLAAVRGHDAAVFERCRQHVLDAGLVYRWDGPWKASPDRRLRARARYRLSDDGFGRAQVEVAERVGETVVAVSDDALASSTSDGFRQSASTLRWLGSTSVTVEPYRALLPRHVKLRLERVADGWCSSLDGQLPVVLPVRPGIPGAPVPPVVVVPQPPGSGPPLIRVCGGGPMSRQAAAYADELHVILNEFSSPAGQAWWGGAGFHELEVTYWLDADRVHVRCRKVGDDLRVEMQRPASTLRMAPDPAELAGADVAELVRVVRRRTGLGPHPDLPG